MGETIGAAVVRVRRELFFADVESIALGVERVQISPRWDIDDPAIRAGVRRDYVERFGREGEAEVKTLLIGSRPRAGVVPRASSLSSTGSVSRTRAW